MSALVVEGNGPVLRALGVVVVFFAVVLLASLLAGPVIALLRTEPPAPLQCASCGTVRTASEADQLTLEAFGTVVCGSQLPGWLLCDGAMLPMLTERGQG